MINIHAIPSELRQFRQWVCWRYEQRHGESKPTKVPINARSGKNASTADHETWSTFDESVAGLQLGRIKGVDVDGVGFVFNRDFIGVDLDNCRNSQTGEIKGWAREIISQCKSYGELSPSGTGLHLIVIGKLPRDIKGNRRPFEDGLVEIYDHGRFFTMTGEHLEGTPKTPLPCVNSVLALHGKVFGSGGNRRPKARTNGPGFVLSDSQLLDKAMRATNGAKFRRLWSGDTTDYDGDDSRADMALCQSLAFWTGKDASRIDVLFRQSGLFREKWNREDYRQRTIEAAIERTTETFSSNNRGRTGSQTGRKPFHAPTEEELEREAIQEETQDPKLIAIDVSSQDLVLLTAQAWNAIQQANRKPFLFWRETIVRIEHKERGALIVREVTPDRMRHALAPAAVWFWPPTQRNPVERAGMPPMSVVRNMLATPNPPLPTLLRIVEAPVFIADGTLQTIPGYNPSGKLYYEPAAGLEVPTVPSQPSRQEIDRAREFILEMIADFPFVGESERAHTIALFILPFVRDLIDGPTPLHLFEKPSPGTGATLLIEALVSVCSGRKPEIMTEGRDEDEWRKRITAKLAAGPAFILIDNLRRRLDSAAVSAAITASSWEDRRLGQTEIVVFPVTCVWVATGNNPALSSEIVRRTIRIRLDAKVDRPWLREDFRHPDLLLWVASQRANLIWSALVLGQAWLSEGRPRYTGQKLGSFEAWSEVIGGILSVAGIPGFLTNLDTFYESSDAEGSDWRAFIEAWWDRWERQEVTVSNVFELADNLPLGDGTERSQKSRLGKLLSGARDRQFGKLQLKRGTILNGCQRWKLEQNLEH